LKESSDVAADWQEGSLTGGEGPRRPQLYPGRAFGGSKRVDAA
jgi:hypothetical protein